MFAAPWIILVLDGADSHRKSYGGVLSEILKQTLKGIRMFLKGCISNSIWPLSG